MTYEQEPEGLEHMKPSTYLETEQIYIILSRSFVVKGNRNGVVASYGSGCWVYSSV